MLATSYDSDHHRLVVLDISGSGTAAVARLWTLDMLRGDVQTWWTGSRGSYFDSFALGYATDGSHILLASAGTGQLYIVRFHLEGHSAVLDGIAESTGRPLTAPRTNQRGAHMVLTRGTSAALVGDHVEWTALHPPRTETLADFVR